MKATGIVRRIDDLGRVVIPKEIRRTMRIREGDALEIFTDHDGEIILKKYSPIGELSDFAGECAESLYAALGYTACVCDKDTVIAAGGPGKKELWEKPLSESLQSAIASREKLIKNSSEMHFCRITTGEETFSSQIIVPIIADGDALGAVVLLSKDEKTRFSDAELKAVSTVAYFMGKQMEQ
ncbi:MAG: stage V sporulation protein T [Christensenellaceae bacterium]|nr:stage V sporulation protein T [Christensenellaceae bacterium]